MKKIRYFVYLIVIATLSLSFALFAGCTNEVETPEVKKYLMNVSRVTLERCESTKLSVLNVEGDFVCLLCVYSLECSVTVVDIKRLGMYQ